MRWSLRLGGVVMAAVVATATGACGKHLYNRENLTEDLAKHHIDLRWGRLGNAAVRVTPELRGPFIQAWSLRLAGVELQDMDIADVALMDEDTAQVIVNVTYVDKQSMSVRTVQFPEIWKRTDQGWQLANVADLPAL